MKAARRAQLLGGLLAASSIVAVLAAVGLEPPGTQRLLRMDARRESDLSAIERAVDGYWKQHALLPA